MKKIATAAAALVLAAALSTGAASAAIKVGTDSAEALVGTRYADHLTGKGGDDHLEGRAGDDVYHFAGGFGSDVLVEPKKVGTRPGGIDTLSFSGVGTNSYVRLIPQWRSLGYNAAVTADSGVVHRVDLGSSRVERAVGGSGSDTINTGAGPNTLKGGAGGDDYLWDGGGYPGNGGDQVGLPASDDAYRGFAAAPGTDTVVDWGGGADVLDLRPWESSDVYLDTYSYGSSGPNSLIVSSGDRGVLVVGHFAPVVREQENGTMEKIVFADETITSASAVRALAEDSAGDAELRAAASEAPMPGMLPGPPPR